LDRASRLFGSPERALDWMTSWSAALNGSPPELMQTEQGIQAVAEELARLEHGMPSICLAFKR
jgi:uncharacterized protein (DUF2384 family)